MDNDWIKDYRKSIEWGWYKDVPTCHLFFHLLRRVNWKPGVMGTIKILPGEIITSSLKLAEETGLSRQQVRTALEKLVSTNDITMIANKSFTHIKVQNWVKYQQEATNTLTNEQPTSNQQVTTIEEGNKGIREEIITVRDDVYMQAGHLSITHDEFSKLEKEFGAEKADELVQGVLNYRKNTKYKSLYLTAMKWGKLEKQKQETPVKKVVRTFDYTTGLPINQE